MGGWGGRWQQLVKNCPGVGGREDVGGGVGREVATACEKLSREAPQ